MNNIRCNNCYTEFKDDDGLTILEDKNGFYKGCHKCETDSYLMDLNIGDNCVESCDCET